ncbi:MAG: hypothetical protein U0638_03580 [Phycisphaerales bacterium]
MTFRQTWYLALMVISSLASIAVGSFAVSAWWDFFHRSNGWRTIDLDSLPGSSRERYVVALGFPKRTAGATARLRDGSSGGALIHRAARFSIDECRSIESDLDDHGRALATLRDAWTAEPPADWRAMIDALEAEYRSRDRSLRHLVSLDWKQLTNETREFTLILQDGDQHTRSRYRAGNDLSSVQLIELAHCDTRADAVDFLTHLVPALLGTVLAALGGMIAFSAMRAAR